MYNNAIQSDTLLYMTKLIAVRLPDDVYEAAKERSTAEDRKLSQVIVRALRESLGMTVETLVRPAPEVSSDDRYKKCDHGNNLYTCDRVKCKIQTGRA